MFPHSINIKILDYYYYLFFKMTGAQWSSEVMMRDSSWVDCNYIQTSNELTIGVILDCQLVD